MDDLAAHIKDIEWYHSSELPGGPVTPGYNNSSLCLSRLRLPDALADRSVLDVGAWDGFSSFVATNRRAARAFASDSLIWRERWGRRGSCLARTALGSLQAMVAVA
jgi:tRNA (mo5U34)-methyltransferase